MSSCTGLRRTYALLCFCLPLLTVCGCAVDFTNPVTAASLGLVNRSFSALSGLSYADYVAYPLSSAIPNNAPTVTGTVDMYSVSPSLPAGLTLNPSSGVISGTPTVATLPANTYDTFVITGSNAAGSTSFTLHLMTSGGWIVNNSGDQIEHVGSSPVCETALGNGQCTLRAALTLAQAGTSGITQPIILIESGLGTISPATQLPALTNTHITSATISGLSQSGVVIDGGRVSHPGTATNLIMTSDINLSVTNLTLQNGLQTFNTGSYPWGCASAIAFEGTAFPFTHTLLIDSVSFLGNSTNGSCGAASPPSIAGGGAVLVYDETGPITINNSTFTGNTAIPNDWSGAIQVDENALTGAPTLTTVNISNSTFTSNTSTFDGGAYAGAGLAAGYSVALSITSSSFTSNTAGNTQQDPAIYNDQTGAPASTTTITGCTFIGNANPGGNGTLSLTGPQTTTLTNDTFYGNSADSNSAITDNTGGSTITADYLTIVGNSYVSNFAASVMGNGTTTDATFTVSNSLIANNTESGSVVDNCSGGNTTVHSNGYNIYDSVGGACSNNAHDSTVSLASLNLAASPANNGGPVETLALLSGSSAIDFIPNASCAGVTSDARGSIRPNPPGGACDAGAFEY